MAQVAEEPRRLNLWVQVPQESRQGLRNGAKGDSKR